MFRQKGGNDSSRATGDRNIVANVETAEPEKEIGVRTAPTVLVTESRASFEPVVEN